MDPYAIVEYGSEEVRSGVAKGEVRIAREFCITMHHHFSSLLSYERLQCAGQGRNPVWNERLMLRAEYPSDDESHKYKLVIKIMDRRKHSPDAPLGETKIYLQDLVSDGVELGIAEMRLQKYRVVLADRRYYGEISVAVSFTVLENDYMRQPRV
uniref:C2 domain-containing protein n=1 Tax=Kalanchoe fedtschenkoi TaxID=63787 RepID=A0A7N0RII5_KALFE